MIIRTFKLKIFHQNDIYALYQKIYDKYKTANDDDDCCAGVDANWDCISQETLRLPELKFPEQDDTNEFRSYYKTIYRLFFYLYKVEQGIIKASKCIEGIFRNVFDIVKKMICVIDIDKIHRVLYYQYIYKDEFVELIVGKIREGCQNSNRNVKDNVKSKKFLVEEILISFDKDLNEDDINIFIKEHNADEICLKIQNVIKEQQENNCELIDEPIFKLSDDNDNISIFDNLFIETQNEKNITINESNDNMNNNTINTNTSEINKINEIEKLKTLSNDELLTYIFNNNNTNNNNKTYNEGKSKKSKKRKNKNKQPQNKTNNDNNNNSNNNSTLLSQTEKEIINFKQNITNNSYNNCNIHKIKPLIHKHWINKISTSNNN